LLLLVVVVLFLEFGMQYMVRYRAPVPHLLALLVIFIGLQWEEVRGAVLGFILGMLYGLLAYEPLGLSAFGMTLIGFLSGQLKGHFFVDTHVDNTVFAVCMLVVHNIAIVIVGRVTLGLYLPLGVLQCVLTAIFAAPCFAVFEWLLRTRER
jgi:rod shape-determining protein MreD